jgi:NADH-quinone oxidoreductase subunit J
MIAAVIFYILAVLTIVPAILVVMSRSVFHAALWLILSLFGVAGLYAYLAADFLFAVQLLVYVGGVTVLLLFVILLSGKPSDAAGRQLNERAWMAGLGSAFVAAAIVSVIAAWPVAGPAPADAPATTAALGSLFLNEMVLPFEVISLVLVAAMVGAVFFSMKKSS